MQSQKRGFTLIELLVVIAIIGLLASIVLASLNSARKKSRDARRVADLKSLQNALELYANDNGGTYPTGVVAGCNAAAGCAVGTASGGAGTSLCSGATGASTVQLNATYMPACPVDPTNTGAQVYRYRTSSVAAPTSYCISSSLENSLSSGMANTCITVTASTVNTGNVYGIGAN